MNWIKKHAPLLVSIIINIALLIILLQPKPQSIVTQVEYINTTDTVLVEKERIVEHTVVKWKEIIDTCYIWRQDTVPVEVPIEYKEYRDTIVNDSSSAELLVKYHGFLSDIDSINLNYHYSQQKTTIYTPPKKYGLDIVVGPFVGYGHTPKGPQPAVGVCVSIGFGYRLTK